MHGGFHFQDVLLGFQQQQVDAAGDQGFGLLAEEAGGAVEIARRFRPRCAARADCRWGRLNRLRSAGGRRRNIHRRHGAPGARQPG